MIFPAGQESALPSKQGKEPFNEPSPLIGTKLSSILRLALLKPIFPMRRYHFNAFFGECFIKGVTVVGLDVGIVTTGSEVYHGRIPDRFGPVLREEVETYGCRVMHQVFVSDNIGIIINAIENLSQNRFRSILMEASLTNPRKFSA